MTETSTSSKRSLPKFIGCFLVMVVLVVIDQWTKVLVLRDLAGGKVVTPLPGILQFRYVENTGAAFTNDKCTDMTKWGELPYLAAAGEAKIALRNANPGLKVWAVAADGTRLREIPAAYEGGAYRFTARIAAGEGANAPTMVYELAAR